MLYSRLVVRAVCAACGLPAGQHLPLRTRVHKKTSPRSEVHSTNRPVQIPPISSFRTANASWPGICPRQLPSYCDRQVSRLIDQTCHVPLPGLPVDYRQTLSNHGDEIVQESHLLPFSPGRSGFLPYAPDTFRIISFIPRRVPPRRSLFPYYPTIFVKSRQRGPLVQLDSQRKLIVSYISPRSILHAPSQISTGSSISSL